MSDSHSLLFSKPITAPPVLRILIAEDAPTIQLSLKGNLIPNALARILNVNPAQIKQFINNIIQLKSVGTGAAATKEVEHLLAENSHYDIIIMDIHMEHNENIAIEAGVLATKNIRELENWAILDNRLDESKRAFIIRNSSTNAEEEILKKQGFDANTKVKAKRIDDIFYVLEMADKAGKLDGLREVLTHAIELQNPPSHNA